MPKPRAMPKARVMPKPRVLIVEDDILIAESTKDLLDVMGYDVVSIETTGPDAVKKACIEMPDVILMDVSLGGKMDGIEAANKIRSCSKTPIVFITGYADQSTGDFPNNKSHYLSKPYTPEELEAVIRKALSAPSMKSGAGSLKKKSAKAG